MRTEYEPTYKVTRTPIVLSTDTMALVTVFECDVPFEDFWTTEYWDPIKTNEAAAVQLVAQLALKGSCSPALLKAIRRELLAELKRGDAEYGTHHADSE